jgi:hypothetical protein
MFQASAEIAEGASSSPVLIHQHEPTGISMSRRAKPLVGHRVIVDLISATTTKTGLTDRCKLDPTNRSIRSSS